MARCKGLLLLTMPVAFLGMSLCGCTNPHASQPGLLRGCSPAVTASANLDGDDTVIQVAVCNTAAEPIYVCVAPEPQQMRHPGDKGPYVYYGGAGTVILYWAIVDLPNAGDGCYVVGADRSHIEADVRRLDPGETLLLTHRLKPVIVEANAWLLPLYGSETSVSRLAVTRVITVVGYWEKRALVDANANARRVDRDDHVYAGLDGAKDVGLLPEASYSAGVIHYIDQQHLGFSKGMMLLDYQLHAVAGPTILPRPLAFDVEIETVAPLPE